MSTGTPGGEHPQPAEATIEAHRCSMWEQAYMDVQAVLDKALGTEEEDGAGAGIAADVALLVTQRDRARAEAAKLREMIQPGLFPPPAGDAEAKLAAITAYCRKQADDFNASMPMHVRPEDLRINAGDVLAIIRGREGGQPQQTAEAKAIADAERIEAAVAILERRYPRDEAEDLAVTVLTLRSVAGAWRRIAGEAGRRG